MTTENMISTKQMEQIKNRIQDELTKRGIFAKIAILEEKPTNSTSRHLIELQTECFQTTPVIFKRLRVSNFGTCVNKSETIEDCHEVWISVNYEYEHFDGGSNGCLLFNFYCDVYKEEHITNVKIA